MNGVCVSCRLIGRFGPVLMAAVAGSTTNFYLICRGIGEFKGAVHGLASERVLMADTSKKKRIMIGVLVGLGVLFLAAQFIRPPSNRSEGDSPAGIQTLYVVPADVQQLLKRSCYDCHSNNTDYPWYSHVQPLGWWLNSDIVDAKKELNFDEFALYPAFRQYRRLEAIRSEVEEGKMPLPEYTLIHRSAALSDQDRERIVLWVQATQDTMRERYPLDSLRRAPRPVQSPPSAPE